jgi:hypothetical protein
MLLGAAGSKDRFSIFEQAPFQPPAPRPAPTAATSQAAGAGNLSVLLSRFVLTAVRRMLLITNGKVPARTFADGAAPRTRARTRTSLDGQEGAPLAPFPDPVDAALCSRGAITADAKYTATQSFKYPNNFAIMRINGGRWRAKLRFQT